MALNRAQLEAIFTAQAKASGDGDIDAFRAGISSRMFRELENQAAAVKLDMTEFLAMSAEMDDEMSEALAAEENVVVIENGPTAGWFSGKQLDGHVTYMLMRFVQEDGAWKLDGMAENMFPGDTDPVTYQAVEDSLEQSLRIDGRVHEPEEAVGPVEVATLISINGNGCPTSVVINGVDTYEPTTSQIIERPVSIKHGENRIEITVEADDDMPLPPTVEVIECEDDDAKRRILNWQYEQGAPKRQELTFNV